MNRTLRNWLIIGAAIGALAIVANLTGSGDDSGSAPTTIVVTDTAPIVTEPPTTAKPTTTKFEANGSAQLSCEHFRNVMGDVGQGILTIPEIRDKTKQFYDTGQRANVEDIQIASRQMLAAITIEDIDAYIKAAKAMGKACQSVGL